MEPKDKISILLAEYNTLRAEVMAARNNVAQAIGLTVPVIIGLIGLSYSTSLAAPGWVLWAIVCSALVYLGLILFWNDLNTRAFTEQLRALERKINALAEEQLLTWESTQGWGSIASRSYIPPSSLPHSN